MKTLYEGKRDAEWSQTSHVMWAIYSSMCDTKGKKITPNDFNPYAEKRTQTGLSAEEFGQALERSSAGRKKKSR